MRFYDDIDEHLQTIESYVLDGLKYTAYDNGAVEDARDLADNSIECLAKIIELLVDKQVITREELVKALRGY